MNDLINNNESIRDKVRETVMMYKHLTEDEIALNKTMGSYVVAIRRNMDIEKHMPLFRDIVENNLDTFLRTLTSRWLVSVVDTYGEHGTDLEKANGLLISCQFNHLRLLASYLDLVKDPEIDMELFQTVKQRPLWDGFMTYNLRFGDTMNNLDHRMDKIIRQTPVLYKIWNELYKRMLDHESVISDMIKRHNRGMYRNERFTNKR